MVWVFSKDSVKKLHLQFENTKVRLEDAFVEFEKLYQTVFEAYGQNSELEHRYKVISDSTREAIVLSISNKIVEANKATYSLIGYNQDQQSLVGKMITDFVFEKDHNLLLQHFSESVAQSCEVRVVHKLGYLVPVELQSKEVTFEGTKGRITTCIDISKQKEEEIKRRNTELELKRTKAHLGTLLLKRGYITKHQLQDGLSFQDELPKRLGDILVNLGYISGKELNDALAIQDENRLGNILIRKKYITKKQLEEVLSQQEIEFSNLGLWKDK